MAYGKSTPEKQCQPSYRKGAVLLFSEDPEDYLPAVHSTWEGMDECYNYSRLLFMPTSVKVLPLQRRRDKSENGGVENLVSAPPAP